MKCAVVVFLFLLTGCTSFSAQVIPAKETSPASQATKRNIKVTPLDKLIAAAIEQVGVTTEYDPAYVKLTYPNGDVPLKTGVCADVIVRAFRQVEIDLQKELHEDMKRNFARYPKKWRAKAADTNIDHRRVPNLMTWFDRQRKALPLSNNAKDYLPGDVVAWDLGGGLTHIGLVSDLRAEGKDRYLIVHNIGSGAQIEDRLFEWKVIGQYRYFSIESNTNNSLRERLGANASSVKVKVILRLLFKDTGTVEVLKVQEVTPTSLPEKTKKSYEEKAIAEAGQVKFNPAMKDGKPVSVIMQQAFYFDYYDKPHEIK